MDHHNLTILCIIIMAVMPIIYILYCLSIWVLYLQSKKLLNAKPNSSLAKHSMTIATNLKSMAHLYFYLCFFCFSFATAALIFLQSHNKL